MTDVREFRALRYDTDRVDLSKVIVPPYDVISPEDRLAFYEQDPHCAIRLILTRESSEEADTDYAEVGRTLDAWSRQGVLIRDPSPALYGLRQRFVAPDGSTLERQSFFAALRLEDYERRVVLPHEQTMTGPKADRLKLLRAAGTNLSSIFLLYEDREEKLASVLAPTQDTASAWTARDAAGTEHGLTRIEDPAVIAAVRRFLSERPVVIADGHHRYETALAHRDACRRAQPDAGPDAPFEFTLACFANAWAPGSLLLPIHRLIRSGPAPDDDEWARKLPGWRCTRIRMDGPDDLPALLNEHLAPQAPAPAFVADDGSGSLRLFARAGEAEELAIRGVHRDAIQGVFGLDEEAVRGGAIRYAKDAVKAAQAVRAGEAAVALYLNPLSPDDVFRVTGAGEILPQKSTFFVPKLPTGLVFRPLDE